MPYLFRRTASLVGMAVFLMLGLGDGPLLADAERGSQGKQRTTRVDHQGDALPSGARARFGTTRLRLSAGVYGIAYSPDGKTLLSTAGRVTFWSATTGQCLGSLPPFPYRDSALTHTALSKDGKRLAVAAPSGAVYLWDLTTKRMVVRRMKDPVYSFYAVAFSPDGNRLALGGETSTLRLLDLRKQSCTLRLDGHKNAILAVAFSPDSKVLASGGGWNRLVEGDNAIRLWDVHTGRLTATLEGHKYNVRSLAFTPDGKTLVSASLDRTIRFWDLVSRKQIRQIDGWVDKIALSPDGKLLSSCHGSDVVRLWDPARGKLIREFTTGAGEVQYLAFSPDSKRLLTGGESCSLHLWDVATGKEVLPFAGHRDAVLALAFAPDGKTLASRGSDKAVILWDVATARQRQRLAIGHHPGFLPANVNRDGHCSLTVAFSGDGTHLAAIGGDGRRADFDAPALVWDVPSGKQLAALNEPDFGQLGPHSVALTQDGKVLAAGEGYGVRLWSVADRKELRLLAGPTPDRGVDNIVLAADGQTLAGGAWLPKGDTVWLWDWTSGRLLRTLPGHQVITSLAFSPGGQILASCGGALGDSTQRESAVDLWDPVAGTRIRTLTPPRRQGAYPGIVRSVSVSPDSRLITAAVKSPHYDGGGDYFIAVWDTFTGKLLAQREGHTGPVLCVAFSPDGKTLASGSADTTILLWDVSHFQPKPPATTPDPETLAKLWATLKEKEAARPYEAVWSLAGAAGKGVALLGQHLRPATGPAPQRVRQLLTTLDSGTFRQRRAALKELTQWGQTVVPALRKALKGALALETRKRLEETLEEISAQPPTPEELRQGRALLVLELVGTQAARDLLKKLAGGAPAAPLTRAAGAALGRLTRAAGSR